MSKERWRGQKGPTLDPDSQVAYLESRGITFERIDKTAAARYLRDVGGFMRTASYKSLFPKTTDCVETTGHKGETEGSETARIQEAAKDEEGATGQGISRYVGLDFSELIDLTEIDHQLRMTFLPIALDAEQAAKLSLLYKADKHHEDPYALINDYFSSLSSGRRARLEAELEDRRGDADVYEGELINKYVGDMPVWVIAEVLDFGDFLELWGYCAERWHDSDLKEMRYLLKNVKELRNACAHGSAVLNGITTDIYRYEVPRPLVDALSGGKINAPHERDRWTKNPRTLEMLCALWASCHIVRSNDRKSTAKKDLGTLLDRARLHADWYADVEPLISCYRFFSEVIRAWY